MKSFEHKLFFLVGFIVVFILVTQIKSDFTSITAGAEVNLTNTTSVNPNLNYSNANQSNTNTYLTKDKDLGTMAPLKEQTTVNLIQSKNLTWKGYFEDMPDVCHLKDSGKSGYIAHHNPFVYFDIRNDDRCKNTVGLDNFYKDLSNNTLPNYSFIVPNNIHDSHDSTVADGDKWLSTFVPEIINSKAFNNTALFIVYDEGQKHDKSGFGSGSYAVTGGRLPLILVSPLANNGYVSPAEYTHYNLLSTVEKILKLGSLGKGDAATRPMTDLFRNLS